MSTEKCPICGRGVLREETGVYEASFSDRNGETQALGVPGVTWKQCDCCKEMFLDDEASKIIEAARRSVQGLLSPAEIRDLRLGLEKSQREMSRMLGIGEKTYCRWESGAYVQSAAFDRYLRLLIERPENCVVLEALDNRASGATTTLTHEPQLKVFTYLHDVERLKEPAEVFTQLLEVGALHAMAEA